MHMRNREVKCPGLRYVPRPSLNRANIDNTDSSLVSSPDDGLRGRKNGRWIVQFS
jgi:hypothetical protein